MIIVPHCSRNSKSAPCGTMASYSPEGDISPALPTSRDYAGLRRVDELLTLIEVLKSQNADLRQTNDALERKIEVLESRMLGLQRNMEFYRAKYRELKSNSTREPAQSQTSSTDEASESAEARKPKRILPQKKPPARRVAAEPTRRGTTAAAAGSETATIPKRAASGRS